jgi:hypothetical protein
MNNFISDIFNRICNYFNGDRDTYTCRLLEVDLTKQEVKFQIKMKLPILKCSISQAINELNLVAHVSAIEACYLGGHYGRIISTGWYDGSIVKETNKTMSFLMENSAERCQILYKDRSGNIGYYDGKLQKEFVESPLSIANNEKLVSLFNSSHACYIGISAGLQLGKKTQRHDTSDKPNCLTERKSHLKLVK